MTGTYLLVDAVFLAPCVIVQAVLWRRRPPGHARALVLATLGLILLTVVFDSLMIAGGLFTYAPERISGIRIGLAPVEDLAYPLAAALLGTALWNLRGPADCAPRSPADPGSAARSPAGPRPEEPRR